MCRLLPRAAGILSIDFVADLRDGGTIVKTYAACPRDGFDMRPRV
jgi:hypothetical protein